jgi:hypothetical protein
LGAGRKDFKTGGHSLREQQELVKNPVLIYADAENRALPPEQRGRACAADFPKTAFHRQFFVFSLIHLGCRGLLPRPENKPRNTLKTQLNSAVFSAGLARISGT